MNSKYIFYQTIIDGAPCLIENINIWEYPWESTSKEAEVIDPLYSKLYKFPVYTIQQQSKHPIEFAAGEFSNLIWGIYIPSKEL